MTAMPESQAAAEGVQTGLSVELGREAPLELDCGVFPRALHARLSDVRHAQCRALQRGAPLPCAHRRPIRPRAPSGYRQARLVGGDGRAGQDIRHRLLFRDLLQRARRLHGHHAGQRRSTPPPGAPGVSTSRSSPTATWSRPKPCCSTIWGSSSFSACPAAPWAECRLCSGWRATPSRCYAAVPIACAAKHFCPEHRAQ